jgi:hypothetical protein
MEVLPEDVKQGLEIITEVLPEDVIQDLEIIMDLPMEEMIMELDAQLADMDPLVDMVLVLLMDQGFYQELVMELVSEPDMVLLLVLLMVQEFMVDKPLILENTKVA